MMNSPELPQPSIRLDLDTDALIANWKALDRLSGKASAGAAVKANAYGLGVERVLPALWHAGCRDYFVAHWREVPDVLKHIPAQHVSVLHGPVTREDAEFARATGVRPVINSLTQARHWIESGGKTCDLMVDTGINRLGHAIADLSDPIVQGLDLELVISHLACADEDSDYNTRQLALAREAFSAVPARRRSLANSAGIALGDDYAFDVTRPGLALYGGVPRAEMKGRIRQVAYPKAAIIQVKDIPAGTHVGYSGTFVAQHAMRTAIVSIGYADGYLRCWSGKGQLQHDGRLLPVLGLVSMDMVVVDISSAPELAEGVWLDIPWNLPEAAAQSGLSQYELLTILGHRFH